MTVEQLVSYGAAVLALMTFLYTYHAQHPKETQGRVSKLEIDHAETKRDLANLIKTVDKLAELVYAREERNGRNHR